MVEELPATSTALLDPEVVAVLMAPEVVEEERVSLTAQLRVLLDLAARAPTALSLYTHISKAKSLLNRQLLLGGSREHTILV